MSLAIPPQGGGIPGSGRVLRRSTHSVLFWGEDRRLVNQLLYHAARGFDPEFTWIDIAQLGRDPLPDEPVLSGRISARHLVVVRAEQLRPRGEPGPGTLESTAPAASDAPDLGLLRQLPAFVAPLLTGIFPSASPRVLAVANADRIEGYYPTAGNLGGRLIRLIGTIGVSLLVGYCGPEREEFSRWDTIFQLQGSEPGAAPTLRLYRGTAMLGWPGTEPWPLDRLSGFRERQRELARPPTGGAREAQSAPPADTTRPS